MGRVNTGVKFEYSVISYLGACGYNCIRSAGSHGPLDVVAWNAGGEVLAVQCKKERKAGRSYVADIGKLAKANCPKGWKKQLWVKTGRVVRVHDIDSFNVAEMRIEDMNRVVREKKDD